jgi:hypothetical protein
MSWERAGKALVLCFSLLLGCGYVGYRHQQKVKEPEGERAILPGSKNPSRVTVLPSSKLGAVLTPSDAEAIHRNDVDTVLDERRSTGPPEKDPPP